MAQYRSSAPKQVKHRLSFVVNGHGTRLRDCDVCCMPCNSIDEIFPASFVIWNHMEEDKVTVQGWQCFWCGLTHRKYYIGFKLWQLKDHLSEKSNSDTFMKHKATVLQDWLADGPIAKGQKPQSVHESDRVTHKSLQANTTMEETFHMGRVDIHIGRSFRGTLEAVT